MREDRLHVMQQFLTTEKIPGRRWDFRYVDNQEKNNGFSCGTAGCSIGELPMAFPESFRYRYGNPAPVSINNSSTPIQMAAIFFDIGMEEANGLFNFHENEEIYPGYKPLSETISRKKVADGIKKFLEFKLQDHDPMCGVDGIGNTSNHCTCGKEA